MGIRGASSGISSSTASGSGGGGAFFFFFFGAGFIDAAHMAQQQAVARAPKMPHCQKCMKKPLEPDASLAELPHELLADEAEDSGFWSCWKELL
jgi:hypothetical protein